MHVIDLRQAREPIECHTDLCIIGSGPASLTIAHELRHSGLSIAIVESGGLDHEVQAQSSIESVGARRSIDQRLVRNRIVGGTSHSWTGRCVPLDRIDYRARSWVPLSGWPIDADDMAPYVRRAGLHLRIDPAWFDALPRPHPGPPLDAAVLTDVAYQFSNDEAQPKEFTRFGPRFVAASAPHVTLLVHAPVRHLTTNAQGTRLETVEAGGAEGAQATVHARAVVLAAGGIENARILLQSNRIVPEGVGNRHGVVGRYLMDHPRCAVATIALDHARPAWDRFGYYWTAGRCGMHLCIDGMRLSDAVQENEHLLNGAAWLSDDKAEDDPLDAAARLASRRSTAPLHDARLVLTQPGVLARAAHDRLVRRKVTLHKLKTLEFLCIVEQVPDPASRITLGTARDAVGLPVPVVDWRISPLERQTAARMGRALQAEFTRLKLPGLRLADWIVGDGNAPFIDVAHPTGATRMAADPRRGVVDADCAVHGVEGLFIAGSSVFPTAGHANPTLMIVALSIRLADHLRARLERAGPRGAVQLQTA